MNFKTPFNRMLRFITFFFLCLELLAGHAREVHADDLPQWNIENEVFQAEVVVNASLIKDNTIQVNEVLMGSELIKVGQQLKVEHLLDLPRQQFNHAEDTGYLGRKDQTQNAAPLPNVVGNLILFLKMDKENRWETEGWGSGVKWVVDNKTFGYRQLMNPGDYYLLPEREATTEEELHIVIQKAIARKQPFTAALAVADPKQRVQSLKQWVQPQETNFFYFDAALEALVKAGAVAGPLLRLEADSPQQKVRRGQFLLAFGRSHDPEVVPYFLALVERAAPLVKARTPLRWKSETDKVALSDWAIAISVLADTGDERALPALRDALVWGAPNWGENRILESAATGLKKLPREANLAFFAQALSSIAADEYDWLAVYSCLLALREHHFKAAVPVLANQLLFPTDPKPGHDSREYNARIAHQALIDIVGQDLGQNKEAWMKWWKSQK